MIPELGLFALIIAFCLAIVQGIVPLLGWFYQRDSWMIVAKYTTVGQFIFILFAFLCLDYAFISNDFTVLYVANNSNTHLPLFYRLCAVWGAHEGSLLLWILLLSLWMLAVLKFSRQLPINFLACVLSVMAIINIGFLSFSLVTSNPFQRLFLQTPENGMDLNPLLQDPGFIIHPPILYMGYVGFSVAFAFVMAGLINGRIDQQWIRWVRPWTLVAWGFLTLGIILGSWWSYRELGWGGWWFWDPVENASFMPWLVGTALIHSLLVTEKRDAFKNWTILLAIFTFSLSLLGTFLVRSGILVSVHAFATDPARGKFILTFLATVVGSSLLLFAWRAPSLKSTAKFNLLSRETMLLANNIILVTAALTVLLGTLYPIILDALELSKISVGPPYFNTVFIPLVVLLMLLMSIVCYFQWQRLFLTSKILKRISKSVLIFLSIMGLIYWIVIHRLNIIILIVLTLAALVIYSAWQMMFGHQIDRPQKLSQYFNKPLHKYGMFLGHTGFAITVIGVALTSVFNVERTVKMKPGEQISIGSYHFQFISIEAIAGANYHGARAHINISQENSPINSLATENRIFRTRNMALSKVAIDIGIWRDLYVALGAPLPASDAWSFRIYYKPFVRWIWGGGIIMIVGALMAASDRRYRRLNHKM